MKRNLICLSILILLFSECQSQHSRISTVKDEVWGEANGKVVKLYTLTNKNGMVAKVTNFGATLTYLTAPDKSGQFGNVIIGFDSLKNCIEDRGQHGKVVGRVANRIGGAQFTLNGVVYKLTANNGVNSIHGGPKGFSAQVYEIDNTFAKGDSSGVTMHYISPDMEEGFPGTLTLYVTYVLTGNNEIKLEYRAQTDRPTVVNLTNHAYFNLTGTRDSISGHFVKVFADSITPIGADRMPTGDLAAVTGTMYDFTQSHKIREKLEPTVRGYDMNFKLRKKGNELSLAAQVIEPKSGRLMEAFTTEPGMQLFNTYDAVCLEMQHFPDSPNKPNFPSVVLNPGKIYTQVTIYKFSIIKP